MSVNPMIFENDSPPRYDLLFSFMKYMYGFFSCLIFIYSSVGTCLLIYSSFLFLFFNIADFNLFLDIFSSLARIDIDLSELLYNLLGFIQSVFAGNDMAKVL